MNILKRRRVVNALSQFPPVPREEICEKLKPYMEKYGLTLIEDEIYFPEKLKREQALIYEMDCPDMYKKYIPLENIIKIKDKPYGIDIYLHTAHIFSFYDHSEIWDIDDRLETRNFWEITIWWWNIIGRIKFEWVEIHERRLLKRRLQEAGY